MPQAEKCTAGTQWMVTPEMAVTLPNPARERIRFLGSEAGEHTERPSQKQNVHESQVDAESANSDGRNDCG